MLIQVVAFTGDNPASMAGLRMRPGEMGITLGTSDCVFMWIPKEKEQAWLPDGYSCRL